MNWQQSPNGSLPGANAPDAEEAVRARLAAQRNAFGQQQMTLNEQLALQNLGFTGATQTATPGFQTFQTQGLNQPVLPNQTFPSTQTLLGPSPLAGQQQGLLFGNNAAGSYTKLNTFPNPAPPTNANHHNTAVMALIQQQMMALQHNGGLQNTGQASHVNNNLAQALALAQQQSNPVEIRQSALLARCATDNPTALQAYLYRINQQQAMAPNMRQVQMGQMTPAQLLQHQAALQHASQLHAAQQQQQQMSANMAALLRGGISGSFVDGQMMNGAGAVQGTQSMNLAGFNSTGLANSPIATAPLLPINGSDLAKPSQRSVVDPSSLLKAPNAVMDKTSSIGNSIVRPGSAVSLNAESGRSQTMSPRGAAQKEANKGVVGGGHSSPTIASQMAIGQGTHSASSPFSANPRERDPTTLKTLGQMLAKTGSTVECAVQNGLLGGCNAEDVNIVWEAFVMEKATLQQFEVANRAFQQQGAELVSKRTKSDDPEATKLLLEAANAPAANVPTDMKQALRFLGWNAQSAPPNPAGHHSQPQRASSPVVATTTTSGITDDSKTAFDKKEDASPEGVREWDGVIENEHDYVPHHLIDEVNTPLEPSATTDIPKEDAFNATNYGFFSAGKAEGDLTDCPLEEDGELETGEASIQESVDVSQHQHHPSHKEYSRERTKSEDNNNHAEEDMTDVDPVTVGNQITCEAQEKTEGAPLDIKSSEETVNVGMDPPQSASTTEPSTTTTVLA